MVGPNGVGKTNLLEALHVGAQGFSPRTRSEPRLVRFGDQAARVRLEGVEAGAPIDAEVTIAPGEGKRIKLNGAALDSSEDLRLRLTALVFVPDRLAVVKGGPAVRRAYVDRMLGRVYPARAALPGEYGRALAQRNEALRRARAGISDREAVEPWTEQVATLGARLDVARRELVELLEPGFAEHAGLLGLTEARLAYEADPLTLADLEARLERDLERGTTSAGRTFGTCPLEPATATCAASAPRASSEPPSSACFWPRPLPSRSSVERRRSFCSTMCSASWTPTAGARSWRPCRPAVRQSSAPRAPPLCLTSRPSPRSSSRCGARTVRASRRRRETEGARATR